MKTVSFVAASSNSGKTTLIEKVVRILKERGLRVAVIKHASKGFDIDRPGKDSWRFREAGADAVMLVGPDSMALMKMTERQPSPEELEALGRGRRYRDPGRFQAGRVEPDRGLPQRSVGRTAPLR